MSAALTGRAIAAVGVACGFAAIWVDAFSAEGVRSSYWNSDGTLAWLLLILLALAGLALAGAVAFGDARLDGAVLLLGGVACGIFSFAPLLYTSFTRFMVEGAWLGVCSALVPIGAGLAASAGRRGAPVAPLAAAVAALGMALVLSGLWTHANDRGDTTYWSFGAFGHSVGIFLLVSVVVTALLLATGSSFAGAWAGNAARGLTALACGVVLWGPAELAFYGFGRLGVGAWLAGAGGLLMVTGVAASGRGRTREPLGPSAIVD